MDNGGLPMSDRPNFQSMTAKELKDYTLQHSEDLEAIRELVKRTEGDAIWFSSETSFEEGFKLHREHKKS